MSMIIEPTLSGNDVDFSKIKQEAIAGGLKPAEATSSNSSFDWSNSFLSKLGDMVFTPSFINPHSFSEYIFLDNYSLKNNNTITNYKKGDVVKVWSRGRGYVSEFRDAIDKGVLITKFKKDFIDKYPNQVRALVSKTKDIKVEKDQTGMPLMTMVTSQNMPITVKQGAIYRGVILNDGRFQVFLLSGANIILEKGEFELINDSTKTESPSGLKANKNLINGLLIVAGAVILYKLIKK
jgi:hypothetical protein